MKEIIKKIMRLEQRAINLFENEIIPIELGSGEANIPRSYIDLMMSRDSLTKYLEKKK